MILRRLAEGVRQQDWFTVVVEVLIVVVGIFLGLQVDDWNNDRQDGVLEREYLERLLGDLDRSIERTELAATRSNERFLQGQPVVEAFRQGSLGELSVADFETGLIVSHRSAPVAPQLPTINELIASGRIGIIRDSEIRAMIGRTVALVESRMATINLVAERSTDMATVLYGRILRHRPPPGDHLEIEYDLDALMANREFQNLFSAVVNYNRLNGLMLQEMAMEMRELREQVGAALGNETEEAS